MHIIWRSCASKDAPAKVVAFYQPGSADKTLSLSGPQDTRLAVFSVAEASEYPKCEQTAIGDEQTIVMVSQAIR